MNKRTLMLTIQDMLYNLKEISTSPKVIEKLYNDNKIYVFSNKNELYELLSGLISLDTVKELKEEIFRLINTPSFNANEKLIDKFLFDIKHSLKDIDYDLLLMDEEKYPNLFILFDYGSLNIIEKLTNSHFA